jgi:hypothetical protein
MCSSLDRWSDVTGSLVVITFCGPSSQIEVWNTLCVVERIRGHVCPHLSLRFGLRVVEKDTNLYEVEVHK